MHQIAFDGPVERLQHWIKGTVEFLAFLEGREGKKDRGVKEGDR